MALSYIEYVADGSTMQFSIPYGYLEKEHVSVLADNIAVEFTWLNDSLILTTPPPTIGSTVLIRRDTPRIDLVTMYAGGSTLKSLGLNRQALQFLYIAQESIDVAGDALAASEAANITADEAKRIAEIARDIATAAETTAEEAKTLAENAVTTANEAKILSETADAHATEALEVANNIDGKAQAALDNSAEALEVANNIDGKAQLALETAAEALEIAGTADAKIEEALAQSSIADILQLTQDVRDIETDLGDVSSLSGNVVEELNLKADKLPTEAALADRFTKGEADNRYAQTAPEVINPVTNFYSLKIGSATDLVHIEKPDAYFRLHWPDKTGIAISSRGDIYGSVYGITSGSVGWLTTWVESRAQAHQNAAYSRATTWARQTLLYRIRYAGGGEFGGANVAKWLPGGGVVINELHMSAINQVDGGRYKYIQMEVNGSWINVGTV